jgi:hypothetical protein
MTKFNSKESDVFLARRVIRRSQKRGALQVNLTSRRSYGARCLPGILLIITLASGLGAVGKVHATPIGIDLGPPHKVTSQRSVPFNALNGTNLYGQALSIDLAFSNNKFVRLFTITSSLFDVSIELQTNGSGTLDVLQGTGYLIDSQGMAIPGFGVTGSASGSDLLGIDLFPLLKDKNGTPNNDLLKPLDFSGIHFDLTFPDINNPSIHVTGGRLKLFDPTAMFGVGPGVPADIVPDGGSTLLLFSGAGFGLFGLRQIRRLI